MSGVWVTASRGACNELLSPVPLGLSPLEQGDAQLITAKSVPVGIEIGDDPWSDRKTFAYPLIAATADEVAPYEVTAVRDTSPVGTITLIEVDGFSLAMLVVAEGFDWIPSATRYSSPFSLGVWAEDEAQSDRIAQSLASLPFADAIEVLEGLAPPLDLQATLVASLSTRRRRRLPTAELQPVRLADGRTGFARMGADEAMVVFV